MSTCIFPGVVGICCRDSVSAPLCLEPPGVLIIVACIDGLGADCAPTACVFDATTELELGSFRWQFSSSKQTKTLIWNLSNFLGLKYKFLILYYMLPFSLSGMQ